MEEIKCGKCGGLVVPTYSYLEYGSSEDILKCLICGREVSQAMIENRANFEAIKKEAEADLERITKWNREEKSKRRNKKVEHENEVDEEF